MTGSTDQNMAVASLGNAVSMVAAGFGNAVTHIRTPNPQDVLSGRGGGINGHAGNKAFRQWVNERKPDYNLANNKRDKIEVAMQIVDQVKSQTPVPGRFLAKVPTTATSSSGQWWVEIEDSKALAKTTQALREGAPKIREALQNQEGSPQLAPKVPKKRKRKASAAAAAAEPVVTMNVETSMMNDAAEQMVLQTVKRDASSLPRYQSEQLLLPTSNYASASTTSNYASALEQLQENVKKAKHAADQQRQQEQTQPQRQPPQSISPIAPLTSNKVFKQMHNQQQQQQTGPNRNSQFNPLAMPAVDPFAETPPLMSAPEPEHASEIPHLSLNGGNGQPPKRGKLRRINSLALSDSDADLVVDFVNPFADESNVLGSSENNEQAGALKSHETSLVPDQLAGDNTPQKPSDTKQTFWMSCRSVNGYLNRLLSFSSTPQEDGDTQSHVIKDDEADENRLNRSNSDYFFHDAVPDNRGEGMKTIMDVVHPNTATQDQKMDSNKSSSSLVPRLGGGSSANTLIRRSSFSSPRSRGVVNPGRQ